jgi:hypothetical protein
MLAGAMEYLVRLSDREAARLGGSACAYCVSRRCVSGANDEARPESEDGVV